MWETNTTTSTFNETETYKAASAARDAVRTGASGTTMAGSVNPGDMWQQASNYLTGGVVGTPTVYSVVGIHADKIEAARGAIRDYVTRIESKLKEIEPMATSDNAFRGGEVKTAVMKYMENVKEYATNITSNLLAFSDKLEDIKVSWDKAVAEMSTTIDAHTSASDVGTKYTEQL